MQNQPFPSLTRAIIFSGIALFSFFCASDYNPKPPAIWLRFVLIGFALVTTAGALVEAVNWFSYMLAHRVEDFRRVAQITPLTEVLRLMPNLTPAAQVELSLHFATLGVDYQGIASSYGPSFSFPVNGHRVTAEFIKEFLQRADDRFLPAVRQWNTGSIERMFADALTSWLIQHKYALPPAGPNPAAWVWVEQGRTSMRTKAERAFGLREVEGLTFDEESA